jgi:hypothetical protein
MSQTLLAEIKRQREPFWHRQFGLKRTGAQDTFDVVFGILLPILTLVADPIVFKGGFWGDEPVLSDYQIFAYLISGLEIVVLVVWFALNRHLTAFSAPIGGILIAGGIFSLAVGVRILPYTLIGLIVLIGAAGFTPFLTAFVYFRSGVRAFKAQDRNDTFGARFLLAGGALVLSLGWPLLVSYQLTSTISAATRDLLYGDQVASEQAFERLKWLPITEAVRREIIETYRLETNNERKNLLQRYYAELTGEDIEFKVRVMDD